jgi:hypothetical protein
MNSVYFLNSFTHHAAHTLHMHTHTRSTDIIDHSIHESVMEIIERAFSAVWRTINNEIMGHALAPVEQQKMEYKELNFSFGDVYQLPPVCKNRN